VLCGYADKAGVSSFGTRAGSVCLLEYRSACSGAKPVWQASYSVRCFLRIRQRWPSMLAIPSTAPLLLSWPQSSKDWLNGRVSSIPYPLRALVLISRLPSVFPNPRDGLICASADSWPSSTRPSTTQRRTYWKLEARCKMAVHFSILNAGLRFFTTNLTVRKRTTEAME